MNTVILWLSKILWMVDEIPMISWDVNIMSLYNVQKQHNLALENVCKNSTHLSKSSSPVEPSSVLKGTEWPIIAQNLISICFQAFLGAFLPQVRGVLVNPHVMPGYGRLLISPFPIAGNWLKVAITRHFWLPAPLCHTYSEPSGHEDSLGPPVPGAKKHPEMPRKNTFKGLARDC